MVAPVHSQSVKLEAVGGVSVSDLALEVRRQIDDGDGAERALLRADTTPNAEGLGDEGKSGFRSHFDTCHRRGQQGVAGVGLGVAGMN